jgi:predicted nucleotide-binding protein (sugar kinase/HSP70/actin superfamily)
MQRTIKDFDDSVHIDSTRQEMLQGDEVLEHHIEQMLLLEQSRLTKEYGLDEASKQQATRAPERTFTREQRANTHVLFGGLTWKHERLIQARLEGLGYTCEYLPTPDVKAFQSGKEFGNNGQCNPTYFTVGNLVNFLHQLEDDGLSRDEIIENYVFFTAGACGPCRFGMYEAEYRLALKNSGFEGFRVLLFQQTGGMNQIDDDAGLEMNLDFFLGIINAINIGDILNDVANQIRPYEKIEGSTDAALKDSVEIVAQHLSTKQAYSIADDSLLGRFANGLRGPVEQTGKYIDQLFGKDLIHSIGLCYEEFRKVEVDRLRVKPIVKITGEFWAQTTEGDGNFNMFAFLERENAQILVEPIANWLLYMLHQVKQEYSDRKFLDINKDESYVKKFFSSVLSWKNYKRSTALMSLGEMLFVREYNKLRDSFQGLPHALSNQYEMQRIAHPYYNSRVEGGEGHLEVAKNIYYSSKNLCHMVLSVKPFGCMPSTQSDGVQSAVTSKYKDIIYLPIETSGEGEINAHSRVQMALGDARAKAKAEFAQVLADKSLSIEDMQSYIDSNEELSNPFYKLPKQKHLAGVAANMAWHIADRVQANRKAAQV